MPRLSSPCAALLPRLPLRLIRPRPPRLQGTESVPPPPPVQVRVEFSSFQLFVWFVFVSAADHADHSKSGAHAFSYMMLILDIISSLRFGVRLCVPEYRHTFSV